ncbi:unnamed protein product [Vitrella brassicaformis CCMP3155]|uniref:MORN repeat-containing protein 5 n=1 Tax=Vitrella brassicaformis (strain CCMP3155) TaxID=1169540 RepID=A0A0G4FZU0_VITBC|nr:unnamed protein product [Vitrella brassicaformis CCMP3155]|eukprot:CEM20911.1 unnamed protein product [Vitrella brassicaformis CCMP3155]
MEELQKRVEQLEGQLAELSLPDAASSSAYTDVAEREIRMRAEQHMRTQARLVEMLTKQLEQSKKRNRRLEAELAELRAASDCQPVDLILDDGTRYQGRVKNGLPHGPGKQADMDGQKKIYEGQWVGGKGDGVGVCYHDDGKTKKYDGQWTAGKCHGQGVSYHQNGQMEYQGGWRAGQMVGEGRTDKMPFGDGKTYTGPLHNGKPHGEGTATWQNGGTSTGTWEHGQMVGEGRADKMPLGDGTTYSGPLLDGKPHGQGTSYHDNGKNRYEGQWENGLRHGNGKAYGRSWTWVVFEGHFASGTAQDGTFYPTFTYQQQWRAGQTVASKVKKELQKDCGRIPDCLPNA